MEYLNLWIYQLRNDSFLQNPQRFNKSQYSGYFNYVQRISNLLQHHFNPGQIRNRVRNTNFEKNNLQKFNPFGAGTNHLVKLVTLNQRKIQQFVFWIFWHDHDAKAFVKSKKFFFVLA